MNINIDDRLWKDFCLWADSNGISESERYEYVIKAFRDKFNLDKYGDLNEKLPKKDSKPETIIVEPKIQIDINEDTINKSIDINNKNNDSEEIDEKPNPTRKTKVIKSN